MISIQNDQVVLYFYYHYGYLLALTIIHSQLHPYFGLDFRWEAIDGKFYNGLRVPGAIGIFHGDLDGFLLTDGHAHHSVIESFYHHAAAYFKFKGRTIFGRIECRSVAETAMVVDLNCITCFYFLCHLLFFIVSDLVPDQACKVILKY